MFTQTPELCSLDLPFCPSIPQDAHPRLLQAPQTPHEELQSAPPLHLNPYSEQASQKTASGHPPQCFHVWHPVKMYRENIINYICIPKENTSPCKVFVSK